MSTGLDIASLMYIKLHPYMGEREAEIDGIGELSKVIGDKHIVNEYFSFWIFKYIISVKCTFEMFELFKTCVEFVWLEPISTSQMAERETRLKLLFENMRCQFIEHKNVIGLINKLERQIYDCYDRNKFFFDE